MRDLDSDLVQARDRLFDEIEQPPLATVERRAGVLRRRRTAVRAGAVALAAAAVVGVAVLPSLGRPSNPLPPPATGPTGPVYRDADITINGLTSLPLQLPGLLDEAEFVDELHGYVLSSCTDGTCRAFAASSDGGASWIEQPLPTDLGPARPDLVGFPGGGLVLMAGDRAFRYTGSTWAPVDSGTAEVPAVGPGQILRRDEGGALSVWSSAGRLGELAEPPALDVRWVAPAPSADGAWWVGGAIGGVPAVAVSRDSGATWRVEPLTVADGVVESVRVSTLGSHVYAVVTGPQGGLLGIEYSADGGATFTRTHAGGTDPPAVAGELVPLPDGRLLAVAPGTWWISSDDGRSFAQARQLPDVARINRTVVGYVANGLFRGYAAFSRDGATWRKLEVF